MIQKLSHQEKHRNKQYMLCLLFPHEAYLVLVIPRPACRIVVFPHRAYRIPMRVGSCQQMLRLKWHHWRVNEMRRMVQNRMETREEEMRLRDRIRSAARACVSCDDDRRTERSNQLSNFIQKWQRLTGHPRRVWIDELYCFNESEMVKCEGYHRAIRNDWSVPFGLK